VISRLTIALVKNRNLAMPILAANSTTLYPQVCLPKRSGRQLSPKLHAFTARVHQFRKARTGSVCMARQAGTRQAARETMIITRSTNPNVAGSRGLTLYSE
jgi:hypothetical protein